MAERLSTHDEYEVVSHNKPCSFKHAASYMAFLLLLGGSRIEGEVEGHIG